MNSNQSVEEELISSGRMTAEQIEQIRDMFILIDADKSGTLEKDEIIKLMSQLSQNNVSQEDSAKILEKMDKNKDGVVEWSEFLVAMYEWLDSLGALKELENMNLLSGRKKLHFNLANFFLQFNHDKNFGGFETIFSEQNQDLEDRPDSWNFTGKISYFNNNEKWEFYQANQKLLDGFSTIAERINSDNYDTALSAVQDIVKLLSVVSVFKTPNERFEIANHVINVFYLIENSSVLSRIVEFIKKSEDNFLLWESLKVISYFANGPRVANTPEDSNLHPSKFFHKAILAKKDIIGDIAKHAQSSCIEVKRQAILTLGFLARGCTEMRDAIMQLGIIGVLVQMVNDNLDADDGRALAQTLSIFAGVSLKNASPLTIESVVEFIKTFTFFLYWIDDIECITNSLLGLSYLLPTVELKVDNQDVWKRVVMMLTHNNNIVKRASLSCIKKILLSNDLQFQFMVENKLCPMVSDLLSSNSSSLKSDACDIISIICNKGYGFMLLDNSSAISNLIRMVYEESDLRQAAIKVFKELSNSSGDFNKQLIDAGVLKTLFTNLERFKDYDKVLKEIYGYFEASYNFPLLIETIEVLNNLVTTTEGIYNMDDYLVYMSDKLEKPNIEKLYGTIELLFSDIESRKVPYVQLKKDYELVCKTINNFIENCLAVFQNVKKSQYASTMADYIGSLKKHFEKEAIRIDENLQNYQPMKMEKSIEVRCHSQEQFPNGDNRSLGSVPIHVSLLELLLMVEQKYQRSPIKLHYIDNFNEHVEINNDHTLSKAVEYAFQQNSKNDNNNIVLNLVVVSPMKKALRNYIPPTESTNMFGQKMYDLYANSHTNLSAKDSLISDLKSKTNLNTTELERVYNSFVNVTSKRYSNKNDGTVNYNEFEQIMKPFTTDAETISELFHSLDVEKQGQIDFRDFICALSILKSDNFEDKLQLAFTAYDIDKNGFIDKNEMFQLLKTSAKSRGLITSNNEISKAVDDVFNIVDKNGDGQLSYTEFREAILNNQLLINSFWEGSDLMKLINNNSIFSSNNIFGQNSNKNNNLFNTNSSNNSMNSSYSIFNKRY